MIIIRVCQRTTHVPIPESNHYTGSSGAQVAVIVSSSAAGSDFVSGYSIDSLSSSVASDFDSGLGTPAVIASSTVVVGVEDLTFDVTESQSSSATGSIG